MQYIQGRQRDLYLADAQVETIFLHEYMPSAPEDYVKVYLFGLMYAQLGEPLDHETLARQLRLPVETVHQAWNYWADLGVVAKHALPAGTGDEAMRTGRASAGEGRTIGGADSEGSPSATAAAVPHDAPGAYRADAGSTIGTTDNADTAHAAADRAESLTATVANPAAPVGPAAPANPAAPAGSANSTADYADYQVEFLSLRQKMYGHPFPQAGGADAKDTAGLSEDMLTDRRLKALLTDMERITGRTFSVSDTREIYSWVQELGASPDLILFAATYCCQRGKTNLRYMGKVITQWLERGFRSEADAQAFLSAQDERYALYRRILQALGITNRGATEAERRLIDRWLDEMHFNLDRILDACGRTIAIPNPNLSYVNKILENWKSEAEKEGRDVNKKVTVTPTVLKRYYAYLRDTEQKAAEARRAEVYGVLPRIREIDQKITELGSRLSRTFLSEADAAADGTARQDLRAEMQALQDERDALLQAHGYAADYTDRHYLCELCKDTGVTEDGRRCTCVSKRTDEAEIWQRTS